MANLDFFNDPRQRRKMSAKSKTAISVRAVRRVALTLFRKATPWAIAAGLAYTIGRPGLPMVGMIYFGARWEAARNMRRDGVLPRNAMPGLRAPMAGVVACGLALASVYEMTRFPLLTAMARNDYDAANAVTREQPRAEVCRDYLRPNFYGWDYTPHRACVTIEGKQFYSDCFRAYRSLELVDTVRGFSDYRQTSMAPLAICRANAYIRPGFYRGTVTFGADRLRETFMLSDGMADVALPRTPRLARLMPWMGF